MKNYIKSAHDTLVALDFRLDHEDRKLRTDRWVFTHANSPDERLTLNFRMSEQAARTVIQKARAIVGLSTSEAGVKRPAKVDARQKAERAAERRAREAARIVADARAAEREAQRLVGARQRQVSQLDQLMRGRNDMDRVSRGDTRWRDVRSDAASLPADSMLTVAEIADQTGLTDKAIQRAINSGALEAYMCGKQIKVRGADVREWLRAAS